MAVTRCILIAAISTLMSVPAQARWKIKVSKDPMTDKEVRVAVLTAKMPSHGELAALRITCYKGRDLKGKLRYYRPVDIVSTASLFGGDVPIRLRFDDGPVKSGIAQAFPSNRHILHFFFVETTPEAKRFRIQIFPPGMGKAFFYEFDITGIHAAAKQVTCLR